MFGDNIFHGADSRSMLKETVNAATESKRVTMLGCWVADSERYGMAESGKERNHHQLMRSR